MSGSGGTGGNSQTAEPEIHSRSGGQRSRNEASNQRYSNLIYDSEVFLTKLREFKPQSLGCLEARRKSSSTLIFPNPQQACMGPPKCTRYPHGIKPTPGYWIECHGSGKNGCDSKSQLNDEFDNTSNQIGLTRLSSSGSQTLFRPISASKADESSNKFAVTTSKGRSSVGAASQDNQDSLVDTGADVRALDDISSTTPDQTGGQSRAKRGDMRVSKQDSISLSRELTESSPNVMPNADSTMDTRDSKRASEMRKRLNKRTMTRDDIDLHKPRRGTPNITITEPSFNQSTVTYLARHTRQSAQGSHGGEIRRNESIESSTAEPGPMTTHEGSRSSATPIRPGSSASATVISPLSFDEAKAAGSEPIEQPTASATGSATMLRSQDSFDEDQDSLAIQYKSHNKQQQHRPSIIREDSGSPDEETRAASAADSTIEPQQHAKEDQHMGLSTQTFQKKSYQQRQPQQQTTSTQFRDGSLELISFEEENYEKHYYGREHWNYFTNDELLGPVMLSLKQEVNNQRDHFHVLLRTVSYTLHGTIPASTICADRYDREAIVRELSEIAKLKPPLMLGQLPSTPDELLKLDHIFIKTELKVGVIYIKAGQAESEEAILGNREESPLFTEFLDLLGDRITLKGFDRYKGGLDTVHNLTGTESVYTMWRNIEIMFHVSTMLPHEENDPQKLQKKRHIGNDIVCVAFIEDDDTLFWPGCIKSYFLHTFITIRTSAKPLKEGEKRKYTVSCVCRNEVQYAFKPYLVEKDEFYKSDFFREWLLVKIVNGERASYSAPKFARMQDRTRSQLLEDMITNLANHLVTGQIPKPYRRGSWRPLGHTRASSPLEDSMKDYFEDYDQLAKDFCNAFCGPSRSMLCDVVFKVKDKEGNYRHVYGVRAIMAIRSRTFLEMLYGFVPPGAGSSSLQNQTNLRAIEMKALSGESSMTSGVGTSGSSGKELEHSKSLLAKRGSVGADSGRRSGEKERRQSMLPNLSKSVSQKPNYLTVPNTGSTGGAGGGSGTGGMIKNAFNRLVSGNWSGWSGNIKGYKGEQMHIKVDQNKTKVDLNSLAICKEIAKIDTDKLSQKEFEIKEFDYETFQQTIEYIHNGQCKLSYETIPGLICAAEHYDLPDLLHACFHHANTHMKLSAAPKMMNALYQNSCFYVTAMQILDSIYEYIDPHGNEFFTKTDFYELYESVFTTLLSRKTLQISEVKKFQAMCGWTRHQILAKQHQKQQKLALQKRTSFEQQQQHDSQEQMTIEESGDQIATTSASALAASNPASAAIEPTSISAIMETEEMETEFRNLMSRLNKEVNIKLDKISNEDLVKIVLPTKVFSNDKIFDVMADESRMEY